MTWESTTTTFVRSPLKLDAKDIRLVELLCANARLSARELGAGVSLAASSAWARVKQLEKSGVIGGYRAVVATALLQAEAAILVSFSVHRADQRRPHGLEAELQRLPGVLNLCRVGPFAYHARLLDRVTLKAAERAVDAHGGASSWVVHVVMDEIVERDVRSAWLLGRAKERSSRADTLPEL
jgi:DNA-binding Lrp family transcriptional regulator